MATVPFVAHRASSYTTDVYLKGDSSIICLDIEVPEVVEHSWFILDYT